VVRSRLLFFSQGRLCTRPWWLLPAATGRSVVATPLAAPYPPMDGAVSDSVSGGYYRLAD
jgi:hypothetical protein